MFVGADGDKEGEGGRYSEHFGSLDQSVGFACSKAWGVGDAEYFAGF